MIVIKLEMWPGGDESRMYELGRTYVFNNGAGTARRRNYEVRVCRKNRNGDYSLTSKQIVAGHRCTRTARVDNWPSESYNIWRLILRCLMSAFPEER